MPLRVRCTCGKTLSVPESYAGRKGRCPNCSRVFAVPAVPGPAPTPLVLAGPAAGQAVVAPVEPAGPSAAGRRRSWLAVVGVLAALAAAGGAVVGVIWLTGGFRQEAGLPVLPEFPHDAHWPDKAEPKVRRALAAYPRHVVLTYFILRDVYDREEYYGAPLSLAPRQAERDRHTRKYWLEECCEALQPHIEPALKADFHEALRRSDLRAAHLALGALRRLTGGLPPPEAAQAVRDLTRKHLAGEVQCEPIWQVTGLQARWVSQLPKDAEPGLFEYARLNNYLTGRRPRGTCMLWVTATIRNVSPASDPAYVVWAAGDEPRNFQAEPPADRPWRLADNDFVSVVTDRGNPMPCEYVSRRCKQFRVTEVQYVGSEDMSFIGSFVAQGTAVPFEGAFMAPEGMGRLTFHLMGAPPVPLSPQ